MYSDKRGIKRKLTDNDEDEQHIKPRIKFKDDEDDHNALFNMSHDLSSTLSPTLSSSLSSNISPNISSPVTNDDEDDLNDKENTELKIDFLKSSEDEFNNNSTSISDMLSTRDYLVQEDDLSDDDQHEESFNTFLNTSLSQCYVNSRPLTPLPPQLNTTSPNNNSHTITAFSDEQFNTTHDQRMPSLSQQPQSSSSSSPITTHQPQQPNSSNSSNASFNQFPALISNTKLFNSTSSSLFNAAAIVDTYFSSSTKKSRLENAKNINHFRYSLFNKSLAKLNKFCNSSDPNIRNSVLVCNTLKRLERQLRRENIYLHLTANGLAFIKLKNKRSSPEQLDYRNLVLDETSQIYVEKSDENEESEEEEDANVPGEFEIDTDMDFEAAKQNESSCSSDSESDNEDDDDDDGLDEESDEFNELTAVVDSVTTQDSSPFLEQQQTVVDSSLCNNNEMISSDLSTYLIAASSEVKPSTLVNISLSDSSGASSTQQEWTEENTSLANQFNWTNMFTSNLTCREAEPFDSSLAGLDTQSPTDQITIAVKEDELVDNSSYLFNAIDQTGGQTTTEDELFSDIDSLITLYDFDISTSVGNSTTKLNEQQLMTGGQERIVLDCCEDNETKCSNSSEDSSDTTLYELDSAIGLSSIDSSINGSMNSSMNNSSLNSSSSPTTNATSCSTSASVNSSSTSFASNQHHSANNTISPVIS